MRYLDSVALFLSRHSGKGCVRPEPRVSRGKPGYRRHHLRLYIAAREQMPQTGFDENSVVPAGGAGIERAESQDLHARRCDRVTSALQRSEEHTSELQSHVNLVCRLL